GAARAIRRLPPPERGPDLGAAPRPPALALKGPVRGQTPGRSESGSGSYPWQFFVTQAEMCCDACVSFVWSTSVESFCSFAIVAGSGVWPTLMLPATSAILEK